MDSGVVTALIAVILTFIQATTLGERVLDQSGWRFQVVQHEETCLFNKAGSLRLTQWSDKLRGRSRFEPGGERI